MKSRTTWRAVGSGLTKVVTKGGQKSGRVPRCPPTWNGEVLAHERRISRLSSVGNLAHRKKWVTRRCGNGHRTGSVLDGFFYGFWPIQRLCKDNNVVYSEGCLFRTRPRGKEGPSIWLFDWEKKKRLRVVRGNCFLDIGFFVRSLLGSHNLPRAILVISQILSLCITI